MRHIGKIAGLALSAAAALSLMAPAFASDYSFTTKAPQDYYNSTSYEDVYGVPYNFGGRNVVDYAFPELEYGLFSTTQIGVMEQAILPGLQQAAVAADGTGSYGIVGSGGPITELVEDTSTGTGSGYAGTVITGNAQLTISSFPAYTSVEGMAYEDGSIGTVSIPRLGINMKVWEGETNDSMAKGLGHFSSTSGWDGNVAVCGHNRGYAYTIGTVKDLTAGDVITYTTVYGTRTYQVKLVTVISNNDWRYIQSTADNRITIMTCLANHPESRVFVQAVEV